MKNKTKRIENRFEEQDQTDQKFLENQVEQKRFSKKIIDFISHPLFGVLFGVFFTVAFFYFVEQKEIDFKYSVSPTFTMVSKKTEQVTYGVYWGDRSLKNMSIVNIAFWNNGKQYLDKKNISSADPLKIIIPAGVEVLGVEIKKSSRSDLIFDYSFYPSDDQREAIVINIVGDEVLEKSDGVQIEIFFTGNPQAVFYIDGRIFGYTDGFDKVPWEDNFQHFSSIAAYYLIIPGFFIGYSIAIYATIKRALSKSRRWTISTIIAYPTMIPVAYIMFQVVKFLYVQTPPPPFIFLPNWIVP